MAALIALAVLSAGTTAEPIVRDDFTCADTTADSLGEAVWPSVAIDETGEMTVVYLRQQITDTQALLRLFTVRMDRTGDPKGSEFRILPDTVSGDSVHWPTGRTPVACNHTGKWFFPVHATFTDLAQQTIARGIDCFVGSSGEGLNLTRLRATTVPMNGNHYRPRMAVGDISEAGICGAAWVGRQVESPYHAKLFVRLYNLGSGQFGDFIIPSSRSLPPDASGMVIQRRPKGPPALAIDDEGDFTVAWIGEGDKDARVLHCSYDASGRAQGQVKIVESRDTAEVSVRTVNIDGESDGDYYLAWSADRIGYSDHHRRTHVWMQGFNADGTPKYAAVRVDDADSTNIIDEGIIYPSIACDDKGNVVVTWADARLHPDSHRSRLRQDVFVQRFKPDGSRAGMNMRVNNNAGMADLKGTHSDCDLNNDGQVVIAWRDFGEVSTVKAQLVPLDQVGRVIPGDLNSDCGVDGNDARILCDYLLRDGTGTFWPRSLADMNNDARFDVSDLVLLTDMINTEE